MSTDKKPESGKDTSKPGRGEEVIPNKDSHKGNGSHITGLPVKDDTARNETEGERRFKEGMANNSDIGEGNPS